jgi:GNAT superfamily N-acetyltransferase
MNDVTTRWLDGPCCTQAEWDRIDELLASRGWMSLNRATSRILLKESDGKIIGFHIFQLIPYCGPLFVAREFRGTGLAEELVDKMQGFLTEQQARGYIAIVESPHAAKLCEAHGMEHLPYPVYVMANPGGVEV